MAKLETVTSRKELPQKVGWKVGAVLLAAALLGSLAAIPATLTILAQLEPAPALSPVILSALSAAVEWALSAFSIGLGLWLGSGLGLGAPHLRAWLAGEPGAGRRLRATLPLAAALGFGQGGVVWLLIRLARPLFGSTRHVTIPPWEMLLFSLGAGIKEELWLRLGLMTVLAWLLTKLARRSQPSPGLAWTAIVLAALAFAALHLPQVAALSGGLTLALVALVFVTNGLGGVAFGWLYWRRGLLAAMTAHFFADVALHVIGPMLPRW